MFKKNLGMLENNGIGNDFLTRNNHILVCYAEIDRLNGEIENRKGQIADLLQRDAEANTEIQRLTKENARLEHQMEIDDMALKANTDCYVPPAYREAAEGIIKKAQRYQTAYCQCSQDVKFSTEADDKEFTEAHEDLYNALELFRVQANGG